MEPFSTSVFKDLTWIIATTTKICTRDRSTLTHASSFLATTAPSYTTPFTRVLVVTDKISPDLTPYDIDPV
jgi:hypothetical protein